MRSTSTRVLIVGCGRMGSVRAAACRRLGARIVAVVEPDPNAAAAVTATFPDDTRVWRLDDVDWDEVDVAIVSTPPNARVPAVTAALEAGVPTLMEKPIGPSAAAVDTIARTLRERPVITAVGYMNRYRASVQRLRVELGDKRVFGVACRWIAPAYRTPWWSEANGGGPLHDYATHLVDLCRYLVGEIVEVSALAGDDEEARPHTGAAVSLRFAHDACGSLLYSSLGATKEISVDIFFHGGSVRLEGWDLRSPDDRVRDREDVFVRETRAFLEAATGGGPAPLSTFEDALDTQRVVDAIGHALRTGQPQQVPRGEL